MKALKYYERYLFFFAADFSNEDILKWVQDNMAEVYETNLLNDHYTECTADLGFNENCIFIYGDETALTLDIETVEIISKS